MGIGVFTACRSLYGITEYPEPLLSLTSLTVLY